MGVEWARGWPRAGRGAMAAKGAAAPSNPFVRGRARRHKRSMNAQPLRIAGRVVAAAALAMTAFAPKDAPAPALWAAMGIGGVTAWLLYADWRVGAWLASPEGKGRGPGAFLWRESTSLALGAGVIASVYNAGPLVRALPPEELAWQHAVAIAGAAVVALALVAKATRAMLSPRADLVALHRLAPLRPLAELRARAAEFEATIARRIATDVLLLVGAGVLACAACVAAGAGLVTAGFATAETLAPGLEAGQWPLLSRIGVVFAIGATGLCGAATLLAALRVVDVARTTGRVPRSGVWNQWGTSFEIVGVRGTVLYSLVLAAFVAGVLYAGVLLAGAALPMLEEAARAAIGIGAGALVLWFALFLPHLYVLPLFLKRECAWTDALEASAILLSLDPGRSVGLGAAVTMRFLTVWRIPAALLLLDLSLEGRNELVAALMGEKPLRDARESLTTSQATRSGALIKPYELLEAGRYLDALNQFQIYRRRNREDPDALRGECLAMLALGHARGAREKLEWWERLDPENEEPSRILNELAQGRWDEGGDLWAEAQARATQKITTRGY